MSDNAAPTDIHYLPRHVTSSSICDDSTQPSMMFRMVPEITMIVIYSRTRHAIEHHKGAFWAAESK